MKKKVQRTMPKNEILNKPLELISHTATALKEEAREQGSKLGAKLLYSASEMGLNLLHKVADPKRSALHRSKSPKKSTKKTKARR